MLVGMVASAAVSQILGIQSNLASAIFIVTFGVVLGVLFRMLVGRSVEAEMVRETGNYTGSSGVVSNTGSTGGRSRPAPLPRNPVTSSSSSQQLKPMRVGFSTSPMSPPDIEIELLIAHYDLAARVPVPERVFGRLTAVEIRDRLLPEVEQRCPANARELKEKPKFELNAYRSEGPVAENGTCAHGWTFYFVDGRIGLGCVATASEREISLQYHTAATFHKPAREGFVNPGEAVRVVRSEIEELGDEPLYVRINLPDDVLVYVRDPIAIADVDLVSETVRNAKAFRQVLDARIDAKRDVERWPVEALWAWYQTDEAGGGLARALSAEAELGEKLRRFESDVMRRAGRAMIAAQGADVVGMLDERIRSALNDGRQEDARLAIRLLAWTPTGLATARLHTLVNTIEEPALRTLAEEFFTSRRRRQLGVRPDPVEPLNFAEIRMAMGKMQHVPVPLKSTYDPESELIKPLAEIGLKQTRARALAGNANLVLTAYLRPDRGDTEALLTSTPVPVPCHMLHLIGSASETFAQRVEQAGLCYTDEDLNHDLSSGSPRKIHRAALYLSALQRSSPQGIAPLITGYKKGRLDRNLRRAVIAAMELIDDPAVDDFLREEIPDEEHEDYAYAHEVLVRRAAGSEPDIRDTTTVLRARFGKDYFQEYD